MRHSLLQEAVQDLSQNNGIDIIAVTGFDASGKTYLASELERAFLDYGRHVVKIAIDDFYNPRSLWQGTDTPSLSWYQHGYNYQSVIADVLRPLCTAREAGTNAAVPLKAFDRISDTPLPKQYVTIPQSSVVIIEVFFYCALF